MNKQIYSVYDSKVKAFLEPFFVENDATAIRAVSQAVNKLEHNFNINSSDFALFQIGEFDANKGILIPLEVPNNLGNLDSWKIPTSTLTQEQLEHALLAIQSALTKGN